MRNIKVLFGLMLVLSFAGSVVTSAQSADVVQEVDREAKFKGSPRDISKFLDNYMKYPEEARLQIIEGTVLVEAIVTSDGKLMEPGLVKNVDPLLDSEALRLVQLMQEWKPATKKGQPVASRVKIPVTFSLSQEEKALMQTLKQNGLTEKMPLFVIDDKVVKTYIEVPHYNVKSVRVMKGEKAVEKYGPDAKNGVVILTTKRGTRPIR